MLRNYEIWQARHSPLTRSTELIPQLLANRGFTPISQLHYGDHGLNDSYNAIVEAIENNKRIALYADYDVDGTMSCVSWIWFFQAIGFHNYTPYIPCRFEEGYGVNLSAIKHLIHEKKVDMIITMDTGITANEEAAYCKEQGITFVCTDHHVIQPDKMPDSIILNPKTHPHPDYQELCGCGITFVLLRKLSEKFPIASDIWTDLLSLAGMATICDIVPLNPVNHKLAQLGVKAITQTKRPIIKELLNQSQLKKEFDETDFGFKLGPRINAVGRLGHAKQVVQAFLEENPKPLVELMETTNQERKQIQKDIIAEALGLAEQYSQDPILFLGGDWHQGVVGIAASRVVETHWKPTWLFQRGDHDCKGSARSIAGFDVTAAMSTCGQLFKKFGGHQAAGGYLFEKGNEQEIREALTEYALHKKQEQPTLWKKKIDYDFEVPLEWLHLKLVESLEAIRPFGQAFPAPIFLVQGVVDKVELLPKSGESKHTSLYIKGNQSVHKIIFFQKVLRELTTDTSISCLISVEKNFFMGRTQLNLIGKDIRKL